MSQELTFQQVAAHNTGKDLYLVVHDRVYDVSKFVDEHPCAPSVWSPCGKSKANRIWCRGGEKVLLDVGGQDASEAFEDVGDSDEACEALDALLIGNLKRMVRALSCLEI